MLRHQVSPYDYMPVLDIGQACVDIFLVRVGLRIGKDAVQERGVRLILPMVRESVDVGFVPFAALWFERRSHAVKYVRTARRSAPATLAAPALSYAMRTLFWREPMRLRITMATGLAALGISAGLGAQQPGKDPAPRRVPAPEGENCVSTGGKVECTIIRTIGADSAAMKRAAIGVQLSPTGTARDTLGVFVSRVTPKGPAENAGIVEGDRIAAINGVDLRVTAADAGDRLAADLPSRRLTREVGKLSPGAVVNLKVYSGGRTRDVQVTAGRASDLREAGWFGFTESFPPGGMFRPMPGMEGIRAPIVRLRSMEAPRVRIERFESPRVRIEGQSAPRIHVEPIPGPGERHRIRIMTPGKDGEGKSRTYIVGPDGELTLEKK